MVVLKPVEVKVDNEATALPELLPPPTLEDKEAILLCATLIAAYNCEPLIASVLVDVIPPGATLTS